MQIKTPKRAPKLGFSVTVEMVPNIGQFTTTDGAVISPERTQNFVKYILKPTNQEILYEKNTENSQKNSCLEILLQAIDKQNHNHVIEWSKDYFPGTFDKKAPGMFPMNRIK